MHMSKEMLHAQDNVIYIKIVDVSGTLASIHTVKCIIYEISFFLFFF